MKQFATEWVNLQKGYGKEVSEQMVFMAWSALSGYSQEEIEYGIKAHIADREQGRFAPMPAHIIDQIERAHENDGRPDANEAWSLVPKSESETVVWTEETKQAFWVCQPLIESGEVIPARMAFIEHYNKCVKQARKDRKPVHWSISQGTDKDSRDAVISNAIERKLISSKVGNTLLTHNDYAPDDLLKIEFKSERSSEEQENRSKISKFIKEILAEMDNDDSSLKPDIEEQQRKSEEENRRREAIEYAGMDN